MPASGGAAQRIRSAKAILNSGVVAARRLHRLHRTGGRQIPIGIMKPDGSGERISPQGSTTRVPPAPNGRVLMFFRDVGGGTLAVYDRRHGTKRTQSSNAELHVRSGVVAAVVVILSWPGFVPAICGLR